jgi:ABC-2 type transport system permease protein
VKLDVVRLDWLFRRRSLIAYTAAMVVYVLVVVALYPAFKDASNLDQLTSDASGVAALFGISGSITSPTGWISANLYANFLPLVILLITIGYGAAAIAGQEHDGHLELVMSMPFSRLRVVLEKVTVLVLQAVVLMVAVFLSVLAGRWFDLSIGLGHLATASIGVLLLGVDLGLLALTVGAASGNRGLALGIASTVAGVSYLISSLAPLVNWLEPARYLSLFYWSVGDGQLDHGLSTGGLAVLIAVGIALTVAAIPCFRHHDLT